MVDALGLEGGVALASAELRQDVASGDLAPGLYTPALAVGAVLVPEVEDEPAGQAVVAVLEGGASDVDDLDEVSALVVDIADGAQAVRGAVLADEDQVPAFVVQLALSLCTPADAVHDGAHLAVVPLDIDDVSCAVAHLDQAMDAGRVPPQDVLAVIVLGEHQVITATP